MPDILLEATIAAPPEKVYQALTEKDGLASWWTRSATAEPKVGSVSEFVFYEGQSVLKMEVTRLEANQKVYWKPVQGAPDWPGTRVTWDLTPADGGTKVLLGHRDYVSTDGSFASVSYNWAWYLISLKSYLETGKGTPNAGASAA